MTRIKTLNHAQRNFTKLFVIALAFLSIPLSSFSMELPTFTLYGEMHKAQGCIEQRKKLSSLANQDKLYLFSENVYTSEEFETSNKSFLAYESTKNIWGLEDYHYSMVAIALYYYYEILFNYQFFIDTGDENYLGKVQSKWLTAMKIKIDFDYFKLDPPQANDKYRYNFLEFWLQKDKGVYVQEAYIQYSEDMINNLEHLIRKISKDHHIPLPGELSEELGNLSSQNSAPKGVETFILWRNYLMIKQLKQILALGKIDQNKDIAIILGDAHLEHFHYLLKNSLSDIITNYKIVKNSKCFNKSSE